MRHRAPAAEVCGAPLGQGGQAAQPGARRNLSEHVFGAPKTAFTCRPWRPIRALFSATKPEVKNFVRCAPMGLADRGQTKVKPDRATVGATPSATGGAPRSRQAAHVLEQCPIVTLVAQDVWFGPPGGVPERGPHCAGGCDPAGAWEAPPRTGFGLVEGAGRGGFGVRDRRMGSVRPRSRGQPRLTRSISHWFRPSTLPSQCTRQRVALERMGRPPLSSRASHCPDAFRSAMSLVSGV